MAEVLFATGDELTTLKNDAQTAATNASTSASQAATSASNASTSATNAATSATNAASSATSASSSASSASTSASSASTSASSASTSATNAATSATAAAASATSAAASAANAQAGVRWLFDSSISMADPGSGDLRLNNATLASVTAVAVSANSAYSGNPDVSDFVTTWDDSTTTSDRGFLFIKKVSAPENWAIYKITAAVTDNTAWLQVTVTYVASAGSFSNGDTLAVEFSRTGNSGSVTDADYGDITVSGGVWSIDAGAVTETKLGAGAVAPAKLKDADFGDFTVSSGVATIDNDTVTNAKLADMAQATIKGRATGAGTGDPTDLTGAQVSAIASAATTGAAGVVELATAAEYRTGTDTARVPAIDQIWASGAFVALTDGANIALDMSTGLNFSVTLAGNRTLDNPSNTKVGQSGVIRITQDATGSRTLAYGTSYEFINGAAPVLSTAAGSVDYLFYFVNTSTSIVCNLVEKVS